MKKVILIIIPIILIIAIGAVAGFLFLTRNPYMGKYKIINVYNDGTETTELELKYQNKFVYIYHFNTDDCKEYTFGKYTIKGNKLLLKTHYMDGDVTETFYLKDNKICKDESCKNYKTFQKVSSLSEVEKNIIKQDKDDFIKEQQELELEEEQEKTLKNAEKEYKSIKESEKEAFNKITATTYKSYLNNSNKLVLLSNTCKYCEQAETILQKLNKDYNLKIDYIETSHLSAQDIETITKSSEDFNNGFGTPTLIAIKNGKVVDILEGITDTKGYVDFLKENKFIK